MPADVFYEWDRTASPRQPYAIGPSAEWEMLALAGIWSPVHGEAPTAAIMITAPNERLASVHNRMPVILDRAALAAWLDPDADLGHVQSLLRPAPVEILRMGPVSTAVNRVAADGPELLRPIGRRRHRVEDLAVANDRPINDVAMETLAWLGGFEPDSV